MLGTYTPKGRGGIDPNLQRDISKNLIPILAIPAFEWDLIDPL
jgi:hypothetical protein